MWTSSVSEKKISLLSLLSRCKDLSLGFWPRLKALTKFFCQTKSCKNHKALVCNVKMVTLKNAKYRKSREFSKITNDKVTKKNVGPKPKANEEVLRTRLLSFVVSVEMLFLLWGIHLCYKVRKAPSAFNESKFISWSIYNLTVVTLLLKITRYEVCEVIVSRCHDFASSARNRS